MGAGGSKVSSSYERALIQGLPDALPYFEVKQPRATLTRSLLFSTLDWEYIERPLHAGAGAGSGDEAAANDALSELKGYKPAPNPYVAGATTATFPKKHNPQRGNRLEWMSHPLADCWFLEVSDAAGYGALFDGSGSGHQGWAAAHLAMVEARRAIEEGMRTLRLRSSVDVAQLLHAAMVAGHNRLLAVEEASATTAAYWFVMHLGRDKHSEKDMYGMVYAAVGDTEMYRYSQQAQAWQPLMLPFKDLRFKEPRYRHGTEGGIGKGCGQYDKLSEGMNLQYGAVLLDPDDVILVSSDGLGDVLDPIAARVPPKQFDLGFQDWHHFAKQHSLDGPAMCQDIKVQRLTRIIGGVSEVVEAAEIKDIVEELVDFAMASTEGERVLYSDPQYRDAYHRVVVDKVDAARAAGLAGGEYMYAKMDHLGIVAFAPKCLNVPDPENAPTKHSSGGLRRATMGAADGLRKVGEKIINPLARLSMGS